MCLSVYILFLRKALDSEFTLVLSVCVVFLRQMSSLCLCFWVGWPGAHFKPKPDQVLHSQHPTADLLVASVVAPLQHVFNQVETGWAHICLECTAEVQPQRTLKEWCLQMRSRGYYILPCSLALILKHGIEEKSLNSNENPGVGSWRPFHLVPSKHSRFLPSFPAVMFPS